MENEAVVAAFMEATGCSREVAFDRLAGCGGHLGRAINSFFSIDAGPSGRRRRSRCPPPSSPHQVSVSDSSSEEEDAAVGAQPVVPARRRPRVSRWDSETKFVPGRSKSSRRRERRNRNRLGDRSRGSGAIADTTPGSGGDRAADADGNRCRRRRSREFCVDIFSDGDDDEEDKETDNSHHRRRRRLNPTEELTSEGEKTKTAADDDNIRKRVREDAIIVSSSSSDDDEDNNMLEELEDSARPPPPPARNRRFEDLFKVPHELTFKGGFHDAKTHAARRARWLLANVQSLDELPLPSLHQNRDVWGNALVARCVTDRFVLWQADAGAAVDDYDADADDVRREEAKKVLGYYGIPHHMLPVVVVVDPVTGQAMDVLHGSAARELNDFMVRIGPFTETKPDIPVVMAAKKSTTSASAGVPQSNTGPATTSTTTTAPMSSERDAAGSRQPQAPSTTTVTRKHQPVAVVAAVAVATTTAVTELGVASCTGQPESVAEEVCKVRVRLADGRVVTKEFGSQCAVAALFAYCRSTLGAGGAAPEKPSFRLLRFVGRATEEIGDENASFESLGLHLTTVSVQLG